VTRGDHCSCANDLNGISKKIPN